MIVAMSEATPPREESEPITAPVGTPPPVPPQTVYVQQPPNRLNKAAAWVGIAAGSVFILLAIFGTGVFVGKNLGDGPRSHHIGVMHHGPMMSPMGPTGGFQRGPGGAGPFGPTGPMMEPPRQPAGPEAPSAPPRP